VQLADEAGDSVDLFLIHVGHDHTSDSLRKAADRQKGRDQVGQILQQAVWERLDLLDELVGNADTPSLASVARTELPRLANSWRSLLRLHEPNRKGNCPTCSSRWRAHKAPCSVWQAAHQHLVAPEQPARTSHGYGVGASMPQVRRAALR
jgi:hypothetical protein